MVPLANEHPADSLACNPCIGTPNASCPATDARQDRRAPPPDRLRPQRSKEGTMPTSSVLVLALALGAGETEVLQFTSPHCPACKQMEPVLDRLAGEGVAVRKIDIDVRPDLAKQFKVMMLPTTVI